MSAYSIAKSTYHIRPGVFDLDWLSRKTRVATDQLKRGLVRLIDLGL